MAMHNAPEEDSVLIRLSIQRPGNIDHPERRILLTESNPTAQLGRSSSRPSLGLQPAVANGWYNSPVMSRHHAQLEADFTSETVGIRDSGSMHGTYLNKDKIDSHLPQPTRLRVGDELTLGMPVFRNREEFQPALVRVNGIEFRDASRRPTTTPTRTFTVPDDCSTDDNEPLDETIDEATVTAPDMNVAVVTVDDEVMVTTGAPNPMPDCYEVENEGRLPACYFTASSYGPLDGTSEESSTPEDAPTQSAYLHAGEGQSLRTGILSREASLVCKGRDSADSPDPVDAITITDDEDHDMDSLHDIDTDIDLDTHNSDPSEQSRSPSWNSVSSDFENEHLDDESVIDETASEAFAMFENDSDEMMDETDVDGTGPNDADLDSEHHVVHGLRASTAEINRVPTLPIPCQRLPPISSVIPTGPNEWASRSHSKWGPRSPSPSDAVLLPSCRRADVAGGEKSPDGVRLDQTVLAEIDTLIANAQVAADNSAQKTEGVNPAVTGMSICNMSINTEDAPAEAIATDLIGGIEMEDRSARSHADVDGLAPFAKNSGKSEFFAARAVNKKVFDKNVQLGRTSEAAFPEKDQFGNSSNDDLVAEIDVVSTTAPEAAVKSSDLSSASHALGLPGEGTARGIVHHPYPSDPEHQSPYESEPRHKAAEWATFDLSSWEPSSAYELQYLKQQIPSGASLRGLSWPPRNTAVPEQCESMQYPSKVSLKGEAPTPTDAEVSALSHTLEQLEQQIEDLDEQEAFVLSTDKHNAKKGKRKAAEISEESSCEAEWVQSAPSGYETKETSLSEAAQSASYSASRSNSDQATLLSPPPSTHGEAISEQRPNKKMKKIVERVGYAALGGVSVGAMVLTSLIYTAPSFV